jgi:HEAT repeat protein
MQNDLLARKLRWALLVAACAALSTRGTAQDTSSSDQADALIEGLRAKSVEARRNAATNLRMSSSIIQRKALPAMIDVLEKEPDGQVRLSVLDALAALGRDAAPAVPALIRTLRTDVGGRGEEALHQDYRSALALAAIGKPAVDGLRSLLTERKANVRAEAIMALGRIGPDAATAIPDLIPMLAEKIERIAQEVPPALGRIGNTAIEPLIAAAASGDVNVRAHAVASLGSLAVPNDQVHEAILKHARDQAPEVRAAAMEALAGFKLPDDTLLPLVKQNVRDDEERVRLAVVNLLVDRRPLLDRMAPDLGSLLIARNDGVARHAAFLLGKAGPPAAPILLNALAQSTSRVDQIAEALAQIGRPIVGSLTNAIKAPEPRLRRGAALALGQIRPVAASTLQNLSVGLEDHDPEVRAAFLTAIGYFGPRAREAAPAVRNMLRDQSPAIRAQAIGVLSQRAPRDDRLLGDLIALLEADTDSQVQRQAIETIHALGPPGRRALPAVIAKLDATHPAEVRLAAVQMIESHGQAAAAAVPALCILLGDESPKLQSIAARTLGTMGKTAQPAFAMLTAQLKSKNAEVREAAALTLGSLELSALTIRPHLSPALKDDKQEVRRAAMKAIQRLGPQGAIFIPDIILLAEKKENLRAVERMLRRFESAVPDVRSLPELIKQLQHDQVAVRLLAIKFLALAGQSAKEALPALERLREDASPEVRKQAAAASERIKKTSS